MRAVRTQRSAGAFAFGARPGVGITFSPSERTSSKAWLNFASRSDFKDLGKQLSALKRRVRELESKLQTL